MTGTLRGTLASDVADAVRRHLAGDQNAMTELTRMVTPWLHRIAADYRLPRHSSEDVVQSTLLMLVQHAHRMRDPQCALSWLSVVARREALGAVKAERRTVLVGDPETFESRAATDDPERAAIANLSRDVLWRNVRKLPTRHRILLERIAYVDKPDYGAVSAALRMPIGSIGPARRRGLQKMRTLLMSDHEWDTGRAARGNERSFA